MTKEQFKEQFGRLSAEWPRGYGASKAEMFAKEFGGHEYPIFTKVIDQLLKKFRYAPQVTDVWSCISEVLATEFKTGGGFKQPEKQWHPDSGMSRQESSRRWKLLGEFMSRTQTQHKKDPDWLRSRLWPNETKEESERKYGQILLKDAVYRKKKHGI